MGIDQDFANADVGRESRTAIEPNPAKPENEPPQYDQAQIMSRNGAQFPVRAKPS